MITHFFLKQQSTIKHILIFMGLLICFSDQSFSQNNYIKSGPMLGTVGFRSAKIWIELNQGVEQLNLIYWENTNPLNKQRIQYPGSLERSFNTCNFHLQGLDYNTTYNYQFELNMRNQKHEKSKTYSFTTQDIWLFRKPAPDFSFLLGSCIFINEPKFDRPGKPYGKDPSILLQLAKESQSKFMIWLGDNWYTKQGDQTSEWGLHYRPSYDRSINVYQPLLSAMSHYAIWDDHDYGPNNGNKSYIYKKESRQTFMDYWANPSYGEDNEGIYTMFSFSDVDFFLLDDRYFRTEEKMSELNEEGKPNQEKRMFGKKQLEWLKNQLLSSYGSFKVIANGNQMLNELSPYETLFHYPYEYEEIIQFITDYKIKGVIFISGDRHHSSVIKKPRPNHYPLYDITNSAVTSQTYAPGGKEAIYPNRIVTVPAVNNYTSVSVSGNANNRIMKFEFKDKTGKVLDSWSINSKELQD